VLDGEVERPAIRAGLFARHLPHSEPDLLVVRDTLDQTSNAFHLVDMVIPASPETTVVAPYQAGTLPPRNIT